MLKTPKLEHRRVLPAGHSQVYISQTKNYCCFEWSDAFFSKSSPKSVNSKYMAVGNYDFRLQLFPKGDLGSLPGFITLYIQALENPGGNSKLDCFVMYKISVVNLLDPSKSVVREGWYRFTSKRKSHGWSDFSAVAPIVDPKGGFIQNGSVLIRTEITLLEEEQSREAEEGSTSKISTENRCGIFSWKLHNLLHFQELIKTQKIVSPSFAAGDCVFRLSLFQSSFSGIENISLFVDCKEPEKPQGSGPGLNPLSERSFWCVLRVSLLSPKFGNVQADTHGRIAGDVKGDDSMSLGWAGFIKLSTFLTNHATEPIHLTVHYDVISESYSHTKAVSGVPKAVAGGKQRGGDLFHGRFVWKIDNFSKVAELLKGRLLEGVAMKSKRIVVGGKDLRMLVYPTGKSSSASNIAMFLDSSDSKAAGSSEAGYFACIKLTAVHQKEELLSVSKEISRRFEKLSHASHASSELILNTSLLGPKPGFLVNDAAVFAAEVVVLKESFGYLPSKDSSSSAVKQKPTAVYWKLENILLFREIMDSRRILSQSFVVERAGMAVELRAVIVPPPSPIDSRDIFRLSIEASPVPKAMAEETAGAAGKVAKYSIRCVISILNRKPANSIRKDSTFFSTALNFPAIEFIKISKLLNPENGFLLKDTLSLEIEVQDITLLAVRAAFEVPVQGGQATGVQGLKAQPAPPKGSLKVPSSSKPGEDDFQKFKLLMIRAGFLLIEFSSPSLFNSPEEFKTALTTDLLPDLVAVSAFELCFCRLLLALTYPTMCRLESMLTPPLVAKHLAPPQAPGSVPQTAESPQDFPCLLQLLLEVDCLRESVTDMLLDLITSMGRIATASGDPPAVPWTRPKFSSLPAGPSSFATSQGAGKLPNKSTVDALSSFSVSSCTDLPEGLSMREYVRQVEVEMARLFLAHASPSVIADISEYGSPQTFTELGMRAKEPAENSSKPDDDRNYARHNSEPWKQLEALMVRVVKVLGTLGLPSKHSDGHRSLQRKLRMHRLTGVLELAPKGLVLEFIQVVPNLVQVHEHPTAALLILDAFKNLIEKSPTDLVIPQLDCLQALTALTLPPALWSHVFHNMLHLLHLAQPDCTVPVTNALLHAALHCQRLPSAAKSLHSVGIKWGLIAPPAFLEVLRHSVVVSPEYSPLLGPAMLHEINCDKRTAGVPTVPAPAFSFTFTSAASNSTAFSQEELTDVPGVRVDLWRCVDADILVEMLSSEGLCQAAIPVFGRALSRKCFGMAAVEFALLQRREGRKAAGASQEPVQESLPEFTGLLTALKAFLTDSKEETEAKDSVQISLVTELYESMYRHFDGTKARELLARGLLLESAGAFKGGKQGEGLPPDVLVQLMKSSAVAQSCIALFNGAVDSAVADKDEMWRQLQAMEEQLREMQEEVEREAEQQQKQKNTLEQRMAEAAAVTAKLKGELKQEKAKAAAETKASAEKLRAVEALLGWEKAERKEQREKAAQVSRQVQETVREAEGQLAALRARHVEEMKKGAKEKSAMAERLKVSENARRALEDEVKQHSNDYVASKERQITLEENVSLLTNNLAVAEAELLRKDKQVAVREECIVDLETKLHAHQDYIQTLEASLREEMSRHAPLYGAGLDQLSTTELDTLASIHSQGLQQIDLLRHSSSQ